MFFYLDYSGSTTPKDQSVNLFLVSPDFYPTRGGAELRFWRYLPGFEQRGIHSQILSGTPVARKLRAVDIESEWYRQEIGSLILKNIVEGFPIRQIRLPDRGPSERSIILNNELLRLCKESQDCPDIVQFLSSLPPSAGKCLKKLRALGIPTVFAYTLPGKHPSNPLKRILRKISFRSLCHKLDCIITASIATKNLLLQMGVKSRIEIIPNGVDLKRFRAPQSESERMNLRAKLGIDSKSQVILSIGAIHPRKGIDILLEAWVSLAKRFPDLHLYLIGMRHDLKAPKLSGFCNRLDALVRASNAVERVHFVGYIENVDEYLKAADVLVFPSRREGMPNAILEAMASGLPCVLTPFIGLSPDLGKADHDYLLVDHDFKAIEDTVSNVLENHDLRIRLGVNGRKWVENTMDIQDVLDRYAQLYKNLSKLKV